MSPLSSATGAPHAAILGIGGYRPSRVIPNSEVIEAIDSSDEWIQQRSGIRQRRWATPVISNRDGAVIRDGAEVLSRIVGQIANPVRWDLCMETMRDLGVTGILELPPAGVLTGIAKRNLKGVETFALKTPDQLDDARLFCDKHGDASEIDSSPTWRMLVAPMKGTFKQVPDLNEGDSIAPESTIGAVQSRNDETLVCAPHGGTIVEWLVHDGDLVSPGQPLIRLHPEGVS